MGGDSGGRLHAFRSLAGNRPLVRVLAGYALFVLTEYSAWIAVLVFAYGRGGATVAGLVAVAQLVPAAVLAPMMAAVADRRSPVVLLAGGYLVQAAGMAATAAAIFAGAPVAAYGSAVIACVAQTTTRPAQATLVPSVAATPDQLTAVNVVVSWLESAGLVTSGLLAGVLISLAGVGSVLVVCASLALAAMLLAARLRVSVAPPREAPAAVLAGVTQGLRLAVRRPRLRVMLALLTAEAVVAGALDLLFVILAVGVLGRSQAWAGYLNSAYGVGAVLAATVSVILVGRRLGAPILGAAFLLSAVLVALGVGAGLAGTLALLAVAGAAATLLDVALRTLLQRSVPPELMGRVFGILEGLTMAGYALGALLVPLLVHLGGNRVALIGAAVVLPLAAAAGGRALFALDAEVPVPGGIDLRIRRWRLRCRRFLGYVEQRPAYVGDVYYADQASVCHDRQVPEAPARHDPGGVTDARRGADDGRVSSHQLIDPDIVRVLPVCDRVRDVSLGDDADRLAGVRLVDDEGGRLRALHQVGGRAHVIVLFDRRHRWMHDVRDRCRGLRRMWCRGIGHNLLPGRSIDPAVRYSITPSGRVARLRQIGEGPWARTLASDAT